MVQIKLITPKNVISDRQLDRLAATAARAIDKDPHLLPTPADDIKQDFVRGNAYFATDSRNGTFVGLNAYIERPDPETRQALGIGNDIPRISESYVTVIADAYRGQNNGTALRQLATVARLESTQQPAFDLSITHQISMIRVYRKMQAELSHRKGEPIVYQMYTGSELPMIHVLLTMVNRELYTTEDYTRIQSTNPVIKLGEYKWMQKNINDFLKGDSILISSMMSLLPSGIFLWDDELAKKANRALTKMFGDAQTLAYELGRLGYSV